MSAKNIKITAIVILICAVLVLIGVFVWADSDSYNENSGSNDQVATSTGASTGSTNEQTGMDNQPGADNDGENTQEQHDPVDWSQYADVETYEYQHVELGYEFQAPIAWGYFDVDEDEDPMNAWFFPSEERELQAADHEDLKESTDARIRIITVSNLPIGGEDRVKTMEAVTGHTIIPSFEPTGPSVEAIRQGELSTEDESTDGVAYSFLMKEKDDGFVEIQAVYKTQESKKMIEEFVYSFANTFER